jgi:hypothetical protein
MKKLFFAILTILFVVSAEAQYIRKKDRKMTNRKQMSIVDYRKYRPSGWLIAPGLTYNFTNLKRFDEAFTSADSSLSLSTRPLGRLGLYFEVGRFHLMPEESRLIHYIDYSLAYKALKGKELYGVTSTNGVETIEYDQKGRYKNGMVTLNFNANNVYQLSRFNFIQNSLGFNVDYRFINKQRDFLPLPRVIDGAYPPALTAQLHYKLGFGFKMTDKWFLIPSIETPILNVLPFENGKAQWNIFDVNYHPIIISVRMAWLKEQQGLACPKPGGKSQGTRKAKQQQKQAAKQEKDSQKRFNNR